MSYITYIYHGNSRDKTTWKSKYGTSKEKRYYTVQLGDVLFFNFLQSIGITPAKSKTLSKVDIPEAFFYDFLRGCFDGDGSIHSYWDLRWKSSFMFYTSFVSAGQAHVLWLQEKIYEKLGIKGHVTKAEKGSCYQLKYAKRDSLILLKEMYRNREIIYLSRKRLKIDQILAIVGESI